MDLTDQQIAVIDHRYRIARRRIRVLKKASADDIVESTYLEDLYGWCTATIDYAAGKRQAERPRTSAGNPKRMFKRERHFVCLLQTIATEIDEALKQRGVNIPSLAEVAPREDQLTPVEGAGT